jgi:LacI family transcriptional regulator
VLNNKREGRTSEAVAAKIRKVAAALNYRTNQIARSLKSSKTFTIGLIVSDISNPFFSSLARIVEDEGVRLGYTVLFGSSDEQSSKSLRLIHALSDRQVDGFIIAPAAHTESDLDYLKANRIPFVLIDRYFPGIDCSYVALDNYTSAFEATEYMLQTGCRQVAMISSKSSLVNLRERKKGYASALRKHGRMPNLQTHATPETVPNVLDELFKRNPVVDGLLFESNTLALSGLRYINDKGIDVPADLSIVSFDETDAFEIFRSPLTFIRQPIRELGQMATQLLIAAIDGDKETRHMLLPGVLVPRASTRTR